MTARSVLRSTTLRVGAGVSIGSAAGLVVVAGATASGAASACPVGATQVSPGVCSTTMTSSGNFTAPAGVTTLEALLVGGGGSGAADFCDLYVGGLAGEITYVSGVSTSGPVSVSIGAGGAVPTLDCLTVDTTGASGTDTTITDGSSTVSVATGGGYAAAIGNTGIAPSTLVSFLSGTVALWPSYVGEPCYGEDGQDGVFDAGPGSSASNFAVNVAHGACGGGVLSDDEANTFLTPSSAFTYAVNGTGSGGSSYAYFYDTDLADTYEATPGSGGSGAVIFRYPMSEVDEAVLAATGSDNGALAWAAGLLLAVGATLLAGARKVRRSAA